MNLRVVISILLIGFLSPLSGQIQGSEYVRSNGKPNWTPDLTGVHYAEAYDTVGNVKWYWVERLSDWVTPDIGGGINDVFLTRSDFTSATCDFQDNQYVEINDTGARYYVSTDTVRGYPTDGIGVIELCNGLFAQLSDEITPYHFGAVGDGSFDDAPALNKMMLYMAVKEIDNDVSGQFYTRSKVSIDGKKQTWLPNSNRSTATKTIDGEMRLRALTQIDTMLEIINFSHCTWREKIQVIGQGSVPFVQRTSLIGVYIDNSARASFGGFHTRAFRLFGVRIHHSIGSTGALNIREVTTERIGSGSGGLITNSDFSAYTETAQTGSPNNSNQRSLITVTSPPDVSLLNVDRADYGMAIINGEPYHITSVSGNDLEVYPWIDNAPSDTIKYVYGAGLSVRGVDAGIDGIDLVNANNCGVGMDISPLYGVDFGRFISQFNGMAVVLGRLPNSAMISTNINMAYFEADDIEVYQATRALSSLGSFSIGTLYGHDFNKWFVAYNRDAAYVKNWLGDFEFGTQIAGRFITVDDVRP